MSTLDEICKLHWELCFQEPWESLDFHGQEIQREAMRAVLRKHVTPLIFDACMEFSSDRDATEGAKAWAERVVNEIAGPDSTDP